ncbi:MAG: hypothetical protein NVSMB42_10970 [Herpetosiphon sp.]
MEPRHPLMARWLWLVTVLTVIAVLAVGDVPARDETAAATAAGRSPLGPIGATVWHRSDMPLPAPTPVQVGSNGVQVAESYQNDTSPPLRDIPPIRIAPVGPPHQAGDDVGNDSLPRNGFQDQADNVVQRSFVPASGAAPLQPGLAAPTTTTSFDGISFATGLCNCAPPDTNGVVGADQYVQTVNSAFQVWSKAGLSLYGPAQINTIWAGFTGPCEISNDGDPVVMYDKQAARWVITQFTATSPYNECIAVSTTSNATGSYNRYAFQLSLTDFPDYPHLGVWPDGYYMSENIFAGATTYAGPQAYVFDRAKMLAGLPATMQTFPSLGPTHNPLLPSDLDGATAPPAGAPNIFAEFGNPLQLYNFHVDWTIPANSTFTPQGPALAVAPFTELCPTTRACIPQLGSADRLDGIGDRLMHRLAYRNYGDHAALALSHAVDAGGGQAGQRWYEIRNPHGVPSIYQQGTYAPADTVNRWMGSVAMDRFGSLALGYSASSTTSFPSVRYTGRLSTDPLGTLPQGETTLIAGGGSQVATANRWGDYSSLTVDPVDDCTFWYTQEYYAVTSSFNWNTRIGAFQLPGCGVAPANTATSVPSSTSTSTSLPTNTATRTATPTTPVSGAPPTNTSTSTPTSTATSTSTSTPTIGVAPSPTQDQSP